MGARWIRPLKPLIKNFWLTTMTAVVSRSWISPIATWLPSRNEGTGQPHIIWPIEKYISGTRKQRDAIRHRFILGVSRSFRESSAAETEDAFTCAPSCAPAPFSVAPYPASSTAAMIWAGSAVPSTPMELVSRLTEQEVTPGTLDTAFSTRALHAAQLMPVTLYCSINITPISSISGGLRPAHL